MSVLNISLSWPVKVTTIGKGQPHQSLQEEQVYQVISKFSFEVLQIYLKMGTFD